MCRNRRLDATYDHERSLKTDNLLKKIILTFRGTALWLMISFNLFSLSMISLNTFPRTMIPFNPFLCMMIYFNLFLLTMISFNIFSFSIISLNTFPPYDNILPFPRTMIELILWGRDSGRSVRKRRGSREVMCSVCVDPALISLIH